MVARRSAEVLVIHPGALGDVLQAIPALIALREGNRLTLACQMRIGRLFAGTGLVDEALSFDSLGLDRLFAGDEVSPETRSRLASFDSVVSWFGSRDALYAGRLASIIPEVVIAPPVPETGPPPTVWEHLLGTLVPWGVRPPSRLRPLELPEAWRGEVCRELSRLGWDERRPLLFVHPGAGGQEKRWPAERFARVIQHAARESGCQVLVHQGPADKVAVDRLVRLLDLPVLLLMEPPLHLLAVILQEASAYLGGDSGVSHLAAAVGAPAVILFPAATRERWAPWSPTAHPLAMSRDPDEIEAVARAVLEVVTPPGTSGALPRLPRASRVGPNGGWCPSP